MNAQKTEKKASQRIDTRQEPSPHQQSAIDAEQSENNTRANSRSLLLIHRVVASSMAGRRYIYDDALISSGVPAPPKQSHQTEPS